MTEPLESRIAPASLLFAGQLANDADQFGLIAIDNAGNVFVAGRFHTAIDMDPRPNAATMLTTADPAGDIYLAKFRTDGSLAWARTWGGTGTELASGMWADDNGDLFVSVDFSSTNAGFGGSGGGGTLSTTGGTDVALLKVSGVDGSAVTAFDGDGQMKWGGTGDETNGSLVVDHAGHVIAAGGFTSTDAGFNGPGVLSTASGSTSDAFVLRVNATTGAPDASFDTDGMQAIDTGAAGSVVYARVDSSSNLYLGLRDSSVGAWQILKRNAADGTPAAAFGLGGTIKLDPSNVDEYFFALDIDHHDRIVAAQKDHGLTQIYRFSSSSGSPDATFPIQGQDVQPAPGNFMVLQADSHDNIYISGILPSTAANPQDYVFRYNADTLGTVGFFFGHPQDPAATGAFMDFGLDPADNVIVRGAYAGTPDLDPTNGVLKLKPRADVLANPNMAEGFIMRFDPFGIDQQNPLNFRDNADEAARVTIDGPGRGHYRLVGDKVDVADLDTLELFDTTLSTKVTILHIDPPTDDLTVNKIFTHDANQPVGSITLAPSVLLGDGVADAIPDLRITGKLNSLQIDGIKANAYLKLGEGLPYNEPGDTTPDTYNNHPDLTVGFVLGPNVIIEVIGDGTDGGIGGGGLGKVTFGGWSDPGGVIRTTQSIGDFTVKTGNFNSILEIDKDHHGNITRADVGRMTIQHGSWGGVGTEIEGDVEAFSATAFLENATIEAGSIGSVAITKGAFDGTLILTDPTATAVPTYIVSSDFTGSVTSASSIKKLNIKGDFTGSLTAPSIGSITAYSFLGTAGVTQINARLGALGLITSTAGVIKDYQIVTDGAFSGFNVKLGKLTTDTVGIDNVQITAASIGNITVSLASAASSTGVNLLGIRQSSFVTTGTGTTKGTIGRIGNISVTLTGAPAGASAIGIADSEFDARVLAGEFGAGQPASTVNSLGNITVKVTGSGGGSLGLDHATFQGDTIGASVINVSRGKVPLPGPAPTARALETVSYTADRAIGAISVGGDATAAQATALHVWAGGTIGAVTVKATKAEWGSLVSSAILAGQSLALTGATSAEQLARLALARLGAVNVSGSITDTELVAGSSIGAVTVGKDLTGSLVLAGATLGSDFAIGGGNDTYQRAAAIAAVTVKGALSQTSVVAGVDPGDGIFGNGNDNVGLPVDQLDNPASKIGPITIALGSAASATGTPLHQYGIEAAEITGLKVGGVSNTAFPLFLDQGSPVEDASDVIVMLIG